MTERLFHFHFTGISNRWNHTAGGFLWLASLIQDGVFSLAIAEWAAVRFSLVALVVKNLPANAGDRGSIPGWGRSAWRGNGNPSQSSCLGSLHVQRRLVDYSPWVCKELGMTEAIENKLANPVHSRERKRNRPKNKKTKNQTQKTARGYLGTLKRQS